MYELTGKLEVLIIAEVNSMFEEQPGVKIKQKSRSNVLIAHMPIKMKTACFEKDHSCMNINIRQII